ncbi:MAG TPA: hypothetical protein ENJ41_00675, partial [Oceanospirillales bacterium]|nr:hypothetical protein [Oceanospirillales bacterium]
MRLPQKTYFLALLSSFMLLSLFAQSQNHDNVWIFGTNGGYDWNTNTVISNSAINTSEGCASISDASGNLIFYTDGINAWNSNHVLVTTGFNMTGNPSSTQSGIIIPKPGSANYYIVSVDFAGATNSRMAWYEAGITGGMLTSVFPAPGTTMLTNSAEKVAAVRKPCDPDTVWIIGHNYTLQRYEVFAATNAGISPTGASIPDLAINHSLRNKLGTLRFNHQGNILASAIFDEHVELMGFNPNTGQFTGLQLKFEVNNAQSPDKEVYGLEFSPNDRIIYVSQWGSNTITNNALLQFNVSNLTEPIIEASRQLLYSSGSGANHIDAAQIQLAPDGNIYVALRRIGTPSGTSGLGRI